MGVWPRARGAGTAKHHLAKLHHDQGHKATQRCQPVMHGIDSTALGRRSHHGEQAGCRNAKACFLAFHVAAGLHHARWTTLINDKWTGNLDANKSNIASKIARVFKLVDPSMPIAW